MCMRAYACEYLCVYVSSCVCVSASVSMFVHVCVLFVCALI